MDWWELTIRFLSLADANVRYVLVGSLLLGAASGGLGTFAYLQRRSLIGDALAHAALPGVGLAFLLTGRKDFVLLLIGAAITAWLGALVINLITRYSKLQQDAALGIVLTVLFGFGIVILTHIQKSGSGSQAGLDKFLFGQASAMGPNDVLLLLVATLLMLSIVGLGFGKFKLVAFDPEYGRSLGLPVGWIQFGLTTMITVAVIIGLQAVGVVLMASMLIAPAAAARQWTDRMGLMVILASLFGIIAGIIGAYVSFLAPRLPTGPWMVVAVSLIFMASILFAPKRGVLSRVRSHYQSRHKMTLEHILKVLFKYGQEKQRWGTFHPVAQIKQMWSFTTSELRRGLRQLTREGSLVREGDMFCLTEQGQKEGAKVLRRHRLWEVYLTRYLDLPHDHVHRDAEEIEHILTPELERRLEELLEHPTHDPHKQEIPYIGKERAT